MLRSSVVVCVSVGAEEENAAVKEYSAPPLWFCVSVGAEEENIAVK